MFHLGDLVTLKAPECPSYPLIYRVIQIVNAKFLIEAQINLKIGPTLYRAAKDLTLYKSASEIDPQQWGPKI